MHNPLSIVIIPSPNPNPNPPVAFGVPAPPPLIPGLPPLAPLVREINERCWAAARNTLLANPNLEYSQTYDGHPQDTWTYYIYRTPNGFIRHIYYNNQLVETYPDRA